MSMRINEGYKQTDVGVIPEDWKSTTIRSLASPGRNAIVGGPFGSDLVSSDYVEYGTPVIRGQNMSGKWVGGIFVFVTATKAKSLEANLAHSGDIVFTQRGTLGQVTLVPEKPYESYLVSQSQMKLSVNRQVADPLFYYYVFTSETQQELIRGGTIQTGVPHINLGILRDIPVQLPSLPEQRAIAVTLCDADALIESLEQLIVKKRDLKQGAMQELLTGKKRLPGFTGEWKQTKLLDCLASKPEYGINAAAVPYSDKLPSYIRITDITEHGRYRPDPHVSVKASNADEYYLREGDLVFARTGASVGKSYLYDPRDGQLVFAGFLIRVRPNPAILLPEFLAATVTMKWYWNWVRVMSMRSGQPGINGLEYGEMPLILPAVPEQVAIASVLSDLDVEVTALDESLTKARQLKQGMMQELLTGRIRLV